MSDSIFIATDIETLVHKYGFFSEDDSVSVSDDNDVVMTYILEKTNGEWSTIGDSIDGSIHTFTFRGLEEFVYDEDEGLFYGSGLHRWAVQGVRHVAFCFSDEKIYHAIARDLDEYERLLVIGFKTIVDHLQH